MTFRNGNWQLVSVCELAHVSSVYPEFAERTEWLDVARRRIEDHLELDFYADGCHYERSPSYHTMCLQALHMAALSADSGQRSLIDHPRLRQAHSWLAEMAHPAGWIPHLQDSHIVRPAELLLVGHHLYGVPEWKWLVERWMDADCIVDRLDWLGPRPDGTDPVEFFRTAPSVEPSGASTLLSRCGYAMLRQGREVDDLTTVVNLGPYVGHELEPHSHHAALDFVISGWGEPLAWEAGGPPSYDDPGYYTWYQAGRGHNSVALEGEPNSVERNTVVESFWSLGREDDDIVVAGTTGMSAHSAGDGGSWPGGSVSRRGVDVVAGRHDAFERRHRRRIVFVRSDPAYWLVEDELGDRPISSTWTIHGRSAWRTEDLAEGRVEDRTEGQVGDRTRNRQRYVSSAGPGLVVVPVETPVGVERGTGPARLPSSQVALEGDDADGAGNRLRERRACPDEYGTIHGLHLAYEHSTVRTVLVPFEHEAPEAGVEPTGDGPGSVNTAGLRGAGPDDAGQSHAGLSHAGPGGTGPGDAGYLNVRLAGVVDTLGPGSWTRIHDDGRTERARWDLDPERPDPPPGSVQTFPAITGRGLLAWWCLATDEGMTAELVTDRRSAVTLHGSPDGVATGPVTVNGVQVAAASERAQRVTLPSEGRWKIRIAWKVAGG